MAEPYKDPLHQLSPTQFPERDRRGKIKRVPRQPRPQSHFQDIRMARLGPRKGAPEKLGISYEDYQNKLHPELGGEDWGADEPEGGFTLPTFQRLMADVITQQQAIDKQKKRPLTQQEKDMKEYEDMLLDLQDERDRRDTGTRESIGPAHPGYGLEDVAKVVDKAAFVGEFVPGPAMGPSMAWLGARGFQKGDNVTAGAYTALGVLGAGGKVLKHALSDSNKAQSVGKYFGALKKALPFVGMGIAPQLAHTAGILSGAIGSDPSSDELKHTRSPATKRDTPAPRRGRRLRTLQEEMARPYYPPNKLTPAQSEVNQRRRTMMRFTGRG